MGVCVLFVFCYVSLCVLSSFGNHLDKEERADCFTLIAFLVSCDCWCFMALPHSAVGWSAVCDCCTS